MKIDEIEIRGTIIMKADDLEDDIIIKKFTQEFEETTLGKMLLEKGYTCFDDEVEGNNDGDRMVRLVYDDLGPEEGVRNGK